MAAVLLPGPLPALSADDVAARLGVELYFEAGQGDDGTAHLTEDGRVLKLTGASVEAAVALALMRAAAVGAAHPGLPRVDDVRWYRTSIEVDGRHLEFVEYAILRESLDDFRPGDPMVGLPGLTEPEGVVERRWHACLSHLGHAWANPGPAHSIPMALAAWAPHGPHLRQVLDGLVWAQERLGVRIQDLKPSNVGVNADGVVCVRDLSRAEVPKPLLRAVLDRAFAALPDAPAPNPTPGGAVPGRR